ncbi:hypothetical protein D3C73_1484070 [compost metagenome]
MLDGVVQQVAGQQDQCVAVTLYARVKRAFQVDGDGLGIGLHQGLGQGLAQHIGQVHRAGWRLFSRALVAGHG